MNGAEVDWTRDRPALGERFVRREIADFVVSAIDFPGGGRTPRHSHATAGFTLVLGGSYAKTIGSRTYSCTAGMVTCEPPDVTHAETYQADTSSLLIEIGDQRFAQLTEIAKSLAAPIVTPQHTIVRAAERAWREFRTPDSASALALESAILEWVAAAARKAAASPSPQDAPSWLALVEQRLADDWARTPTLAELAAEANVHPAYLARAFRRRFACSVGEYLRRRRIEWATAALVTTDESLASIALRAGFCDQSHFTRVFVRATGERPGAYRLAHAETARRPGTHDVEQGEDN